VCEVERVLMQLGQLARQRPEHDGVRLLADDASEALLVLLDVIVQQGEAEAA
jgi:hypothetical protein